MKRSLRLAPDQYSLTCPFHLKSLTGLARLLVLAPTLAFAQPVVESTVPDNIRQMIQQSQAQNPYEQMARLQVSTRYAEFLDSLGTDMQKRRAVEDALVGVVSERAALSAEVAAGRATAAQLAAISGYDYVRATVMPLLNSAELQRLDAQQGMTPEQQLRLTYGPQLERVAPDIDPEIRDLVLNTLARYMLLEEDDTQSTEQMVRSQLMSLRSAQDELQPQLSGEILAAVNSFIDQIRSNLFLNQSMYDSLNQ